MEVREQRRAKREMLKWMEFSGGREMRTVIRDGKSERRTIDGGVPQGSVLAPNTFRGICE